VAVVGGGIVGARTARELLGPGPDGRPTTSHVALSTRRSDRRDQLRSTFGDAAAVRLQEGTVDGGDATGPADVVVVCREPRQQLDVVRAALEAGSHVVATTDDPDEVEAVLRLHPLAVERDRTVVVGAAMSPGLTCLLARHAAGLLDRVDEIHVARDGAAGPACARQRLKALRGAAQEWRDGTWVRRAGFSGRELCWFPDPIGARDCYRADLAEPLVLVDAFPTASRVSARLAASPVDRVFAPLPVLVGPPVEGGPGAARVELRGLRDGRREIVVYGVLDRPGVAAAATAAVLALHVAAGVLEPGSHGAAAIPDPVPVLRELARRGVRSAVFAGA
jgi:saccharopine dehydrogenase-like NADP-dependent oxidoreductase